MTRVSGASRFVATVLGGGLALALCAPVVSSAQGTTVGTYRVSRPNRALFGGGYGDTEQSLSLQASLASAFEHITFPADSSGSAVPLPETSHVGRATLSYSISKSRVGLDAAAGVSAFYFGGFDEAALVGQNGSLAGHYTISSRTSLSGTFDAARQPLSVDSYLPGFYGTGGVVPSEYASGTVPGIYQYWRAGTEINHRLAQRISLSAAYERRESDWEGSQSERQAAEFWRAGLGYRLNRVLGLRVGYGEGIGRFSNTDPDGTEAPRSRSIDAGLEFEQALSLSRRTRLTFRSGSSAVSDSGQTRYWLTGAAAVTREIGRTWSLSVGYDRKVDMHETFQGVTFSDSLVTSLRGLIQRRLQFYSTASAAVGSVGLTRAGEVDNKYTAFQAQSGVTVALSRTLGLSVSGFFSRHDFGQDLSLPIPNQVQRLGVRAGVDLWVPIFHRMRSPNAAR